MRIYNLILTIISSLALVFGYITEYIMGYEPCELCLYQRYVYGLLITSSLFCLFYKKYNQLFLSISSFLTLLGILISAFHSAVERGWIRYQSQCTGYIESPHSLEAIIKSINQAPLTHCDILGPEFFFLTMANWGTILFVILFIISLIQWIKH